MKVGRMQEAEMRKRENQGKKTKNMEYKRWGLRKWDGKKAMKRNGGGCQERREQ